MNARTCIVVAEDRPDCEPGVRLLVASLIDADIDADILVTFPPAGDKFGEWVRTLPRVRLSVEPVPGAQHWNVKPQALMAALDDGYDYAVWVDSDIILAGTRFAKVLASLGRGNVVVLEEPRFGNAASAGSRPRTEGWGLEVGRTFERTLNSGIVGCSAAHRPLLERWRAIIESQTYRDFQSIPVHDRPLHAIGDQDVLTALIGSTEFSSFPVEVLPEGRDVVQYLTPGCYGVGDRFRAVTGSKPFAYHAQGPKPWRRGGGVNVETSPYLLVAQDLCRRWGWQPFDWMVPTGSSARLLRAMTFESPHLAGFPMALTQQVGSGLKRRLTGRRTTTPSAETT